MNIAIIGAGIGGLTTALFLEKLGISVKVFEQTSEIKPVGAGIILAHNAMQVFDKLGIKEDITKLGNPLTAITINTAKFKVINKIETHYFDEKFSVKSIAIQRGRLQKFLISQLNTNCIQLNKKVVEIKVSANTTIVFSDNEEAAFDAVIAADGIHSVVRKKLFNETPLRKPKQMCWRGVANVSLPSTFTSELNEIWDKGSRFGFVKIATNEVYWYGLHSSHDKLQKADLLHYFKNYDPIVSEIISKTHIDKVFKNEIADLKPISSWFKNTVCLLGDAAHATTPNMGQGACQAIEDAYVLSHYLSKYPVSDAFSKFEQARKNKADMVVNLSWRLGKLSQIQNPTISAIRNVAMRLIPPKYNVSQTEKIYELVKL